MNLPSVVFICEFDQQKAHHMIKNLIEIDKLPNQEKLTDLNKVYQWNIDNKYYTCNLNVFVCKTFAELENWSNDQLNNIEAIIIHIDPTKSETIEFLKECTEFIEKMEISVQILSVDECKDNDVISNENLLLFAVENSFELVNMSEKESDCQNEFKDVYGMDRIRESLHSNTWTNIRMKKDKKSIKSSDKINDKSKRTANQDESYESLFKDLINFKNKADTLSFHDKHIFADKIASTFLDVLDESD